MNQKLLITILVVVFLLAACSPSSTTDELNEEAQIYVAAIREVQTIEKYRSLVYLIITTEDLAIFDGTVTPAQPFPMDLQEAITTELADETYEIIWIETFEDAPISPENWRETPGWKIADGDGMVITFGNIHHQDDGTVQLNFFMTCADMCGSGMNYVLTPNNGIWQVSGAVGPEIAS